MYKYIYPQKMVLPLNADGRLCLVSPIRCFPAIRTK